MSLIEDLFYHPPEVGLSYGKNFHCQLVPSPPADSRDLRSRLRAPSSFEKSLVSCAWTFPNLSPFPAGTETALPPVALIGGSPIVDAAAGQGVGRDTAALQHVELALGDKALLSKLRLDAPDHGGRLAARCF